MGLSAFTDGLTSGLTTGMNIKNSKRYADLYQRYADQKDEELSLKRKQMDQELTPEQFFSSFADAIDGLQTPSYRSDGSSAPMNVAPTPQSVALKPVSERPGYGMAGIKGYAEGGLIGLGNGVFNGGAAPSSMGLSDVAPQPQQAPPPPQENLTPQQRIAKAMMTTDLLSNPDKLSKLAAFADMHGMGKVITPWLERAYTAKKSGMIDGAMQLMQGRVDDAIDSLAKGGMKLADRPQPADPNNPRLWKINIDGVGEKVMDIGDLLQTTLDPKEYLKHDLAKSESQGKRNVSDSQVRANDARVQVSNAQVGKLGEETRTIKAERGATTGGGLTGSTLAKLPAPVATAEWLVQKGVYPDHKTAFNAVKTLNDKSPAAQRMELIKSVTQGGMTSLADAAKEVDEFIGQQGAGSTPTAAAPKVRKFNPKTGKFD